MAIPAIREHRHKARCNYLRRCVGPKRRKGSIVCGYTRSISNGRLSSRAKDHEGTDWSDATKSNRRRCGPKQLCPLPACQFHISLDSQGEEQVDRNGSVQFPRKNQFASNQATRSSKSEGQHHQGADIGLKHFKQSHRVHRLFHHGFLHGEHTRMLDFAFHRNREKLLLDSSGHSHVMKTIELLGILLDHGRQGEQSQSARTGNL